MFEIPSPVSPSIGLRKVTLRYFRHPYFQAFCNNCSWTSYDYPTEDQASDRGESHAERCCARINTDRALQVDVTPVPVMELSIGDAVLLRDLRVLWVENIAEFGDDQVMITYNIEGLEPQIMTVPTGQVVKVLGRG